MECFKCKGNCVKNGIQLNGTQRYYCKTCKLSFQEKYTNKACKTGIDSKITTLLKEACGIRSISRILDISTNTVMSRIISFSKTVTKPIPFFGKEYEMDEICTFVGKKSCLRWIVYAIRKDTREVVDFRIGRRTNKTLKAVTDKLQLARAKKIYTDKLLNYKTLIDANIHSTTARGTNWIERNNLTIRTHLKRLGRRTICYSRSAVMLSACLRIYFWG